LCPILKANNKQEKLAQGVVYGSLNYCWQLQDQPVGKKEQENEEDGKVKVEREGGGGEKGRSTPTK
jgi:hypothetical protein